MESTLLGKVALNFVLEIGSLEQESANSDPLAKPCLLPVFVWPVSSEELSHV